MSKKLTLLTMSPVKPLEKTAPIGHIDSHDRSRSRTPDDRPDPVIDPSGTQPGEQSPAVQEDGESPHVDEYA
ncbi:hypothetical protein [Methylohalobius crimeensis]|uniref:hypothetical protein n=1 Tax=Methylohalobius crimeensis TaxID=244365 RepID=UPI001269662B|nr:hypothetical protein [Methylohalobius crimeensis]